MLKGADGSLWKYVPCGDNENMLIDADGNKYKGGDSSLDTAASYLNELRSSDFRGQVDNLVNKGTHTFEVVFTSDNPYDSISGQNNTTSSIISVNEEMRDESVVAFGMAVLSQDYLQTQNDDGVSIGGQERSEFKLDVDTNPYSENYFTPKFDIARRGFQNMLRTAFGLEQPQTNQTNNVSAGSSDGTGSGRGEATGEGISTPIPCELLDTGNEPVIIDTRKKDN